MNSGIKQNYVGNFCELLGQSLMGGRLCRDENGDIWLWKVDTSLEVKGSGLQSSYGFRLDLNQIENYRQKMETGFLFDRVRYLFVAYDNKVVRKKGRRRTSLAFHKSEREVNSYVAHNILWAVLVDFTIIKRLEEIRKHSERSILGSPGTKTVDLKCREIHSLANGGFEKFLKTLDLEPEDFVRFHGKVRVKVSPTLFTSYRPSFDFTCIIPRKEKTPFRKLLKRRRLPLKEVV